MPEPSSLLSASRSSIFAQDSPCGEPTNECERRTQGRFVGQTNETLVDGCSLSTHRQGVSGMEGAKELLGTSEKAWGTCRQTRIHPNRCVVRAPMSKPNDPEVLAVVALPSREDRRHREALLARLMLVAIDLVLSGEGLGLETARDLVREVRHAYPELAAERGEL